MQYECNKSGPIGAYVHKLQHFSNFRILGYTLITLTGIPQTSKTYFKTSWACSSDGERNKYRQNSGRETPKGAT